MANDFSDYLFLSHDSSTGCDNDGSSEYNDVTNIGNGRHDDEHACAKLGGNLPNGICKGRLEPPTGHLCNVQKVITDDCNDELLSSRRSAEMTLDDQKTHRVRSWQTGGHETLSWDEKFEHLNSRKQIGVRDPRRTYSSIGDLRQILQRLKTELNDPDPGRLVRGDPDGQDSDRVTLLRPQPVYRSRRSLPGRLTDDHVTSGKHEARKKYSRRGSVKFADEFGLNLNTFAMIPSRFGANKDSNDRKWNSDDEISTFIHRNTATDGFRGMGPGWDLARDLRLFLTDDEDDQTLFWWDWNSLEFRSKQQLFDHDLQGPSNYHRLSRGRRCSSKQEVTKPEVEKEEVNGQLHEFRLRFEQPFADLDRFQRTLRENFLCLENVRVDDRSSKSGRDDDLRGTEPSRKRQGTTILCSIKVRHTNGGQFVVFARCTDNDWATHADLPAQHLSGVTNLGFDYDTFCFAVRKPVQPPREEDNGAVSFEPTSAVEFALCCRVTNEGGAIISHWDNNGGANYRIEWFDD